MADSLQFSVAYQANTAELTLRRSATLAELQSLLSTQFKVNPQQQKLIHKGHRLVDPTTLLSALFPPTTVAIHPVKLLLVGPSEPALSDLRAIESERTRKKLAFHFHSEHPAPKVRNTNVGTIGAGDEQYTFLGVVPFPSEVPCEKERKAMLEKLVRDPAVKHVMVQHKYVVGELTELHPILQPTLLGLNKNAGEQISLRLLTNDLEGTRAYREIRRVLLHELVHNTYGDHDNSFNELNSLLNKEVAAFELAQGITLPPGSEHETPWSPSGEEDVVRTARTLEEVDVASARRTLLRSGPEDELEEKRERARLAAERRRRESEGRKEAFRD